MVEHLKAYTSKMDQVVSRLRSEHEAEKNKLLQTLRKSEARHAAAVAETKKLRQEFEQAAQDWKAKVKEEYENNVIENDSSVPPISDRYENERISSAESLST